MKKLLIGLLLLATAHITAQETGNIAGTVTDKSLNNEVLPFANILIAGTTKGISTDFDGLYELNDIEAGTYKVVFSFLGLETQTIEIIVEVGKTTKLDVALDSAGGAATT